MKKLLLLFLIAVFSQPALGRSLCYEYKTQVSDTHKTNLLAWKEVMGNKNFQEGTWTITETNLPDGDNPCIGSASDDANKCKSQMLAVVSGKQMGKNLMVALETSVGGTRFCPMTVYAQNQDGHVSTWLGYRAFSTQDSKCVWLCRKGYTGADCTTTVNNDKSNVTYCDTSLLKKDAYKTYTYAAANDKKADMALWHSDCNTNTQLNSGVAYEAREGMMLISGWLDSGHGAWIRPYVAYGYYYRTGGNWFSPIGKSWLNIIPAKNGSKDIPAALACKSGYEPNSDSTDCVPIKDELCGGSGGGNPPAGDGGETNGGFCSDWPVSNFDSSKHEERTPEGSSCKKWRCKNGALVAPGSNECAACSGGADPDDFTCVTCPAGSSFDETATDRTEFGYIEDYCKATGCSGWNISGVSGAEADNLTIISKGGCYQWRCKDNSLALTGAGAKQCVSCDSGRKGIVDGMCITCSSGYLFDMDASSSNYCVPQPAWCPGWSESVFDASKHDRVSVNNGGCSQWRCLTKGEALSAPGSATCSPCGGSSADKGVSPDDGTCKTCPNGMFFSAEATDETEKFCVASWCSGWDSSRFDSSTHVKQLMGNCYQWRCKSEHRVLSAPGSAECVRYGYDSRTEGVNPENGMVVKCSNGKFFDETAVNAEEKYCVETISLSNEELAQGGQNNVLNACWIQKSKERYINCITSFIRNKKLR